MTSEEFQELAMKVISREASAFEQASFKKLIATDPARSQEFNQLKSTHDALKMGLPATDALKTQGAVLPKHRLNEPQAAVRESYANQPANIEKSPLQLWFQKFSYKAAITAFPLGLALSICICMAVIYFTNRQYIEWASYEQNLTRGGERTSPIAIPGGVKPVLFQSEESLEVWKNASFMSRQKAKIWIDEEASTLHIIRPDNLGYPKDTATEISKDPVIRQEQVRRMVDALK